MSETAIEALKWKSPKGIIEPPKPTRIDIAPADAAYAWHRAVGVRIDRVGATLAILAEPAFDGMRRVHIGRYGHAVLRARPLGGEMMHGADC